MDQFFTLPLMGSEFAFWLRMVHFTCIGIGATAGLAAGPLFLWSIKEGPLTSSKFTWLMRMSQIVLWSYLSIVGTGFSLAVMKHGIDGIAPSPTFVSKFIMVALIMGVNAWFMHRHHLPYLKETVDRRAIFRDDGHPHEKWVLLSGAISGCTWGTVLLISLINHWWKLQYWHIWSLYGLSVLIAFTIALPLLHLFFGKRTNIQGATLLGRTVPLGAAYAVIGILPIILFESNSSAFAGR